MIFSVPSILHKALCCRVICWSCTTKTPPARYAYHSQVMDWSIRPFYDGSSCGAKSFIRETCETSHTHYYQWTHFCSTLVSMHTVRPCRSTVCLTYRSIVSSVPYRLSTMAGSGGLSHAAWFSSSFVVYLFVLSIFKNDRTSITPSIRICALARTKRRFGICNHCALFVWEEK